ncbi:MAG: hypothetical protein MJZ81_07385 [Bacteroidales bacterium]|nr:hypothetical protein [Bacteroidales bacterium]
MALSALAIIRAALQESAQNDLAPNVTVRKGEEKLVPATDRTKAEESAVCSDKAVDEAVDGIDEWWRTQGAEPKDGTRIVNSPVESEAKETALEAGRRMERKQAEAGARPSHAEDGCCGCGGVFASALDELRLDEIKDGRPSAIAEDGILGNIGNAIKGALGGVQTQKKPMTAAQQLTGSLRDHIERYHKGGEVKNCKYADKVAKTAKQMGLNVSSILNEAQGYEKGSAEAKANHDRYDKKKAREIWPNEGEASDPSSPDEESRWDGEGFDTEAYQEFKEKTKGMAVGSPELEKARVEYAMQQLGTMEGAAASTIAQMAESEKKQGVVGKAISKLKELMGHKDPKVSGMSKAMLESADIDYGEEGLDASGSAGVDVGTMKEVTQAEIDRSELEHPVETSALESVPPREPAGETPVSQPDQQTKQPESVDQPVTGQAEVGAAQSDTTEADEQKINAIVKDLWNKNAGKRPSWDDLKSALEKDPSGSLGKYFPEVKAQIMDQMAESAESDASTAWSVLKQRFPGMADDIESLDKKLASLDKTLTDDQKRDYYLNADLEGDDLKTFLQSPPYGFSDNEIDSLMKCHKAFESLGPNGEFSVGDKLGGMSNESMHGIANADQGHALQRDRTAKLNAMYKEIEDGIRAQEIAGAGNPSTKDDIRKNLEGEVADRINAVDRCRNEDGSLESAEDHWKHCKANPKSNCPFLRHVLGKNVESINQMSEALKGQEEYENPRIGKELDAREAEYNASKEAERNAHAALAADPKNEELYDAHQEALQKMKDAKKRLDDGIADPDSLIEAYNQRKAAAAQTKQEVPAQEPETQPAETSVPDSPETEEVENAQNGGAEEPAPNEEAPDSASIVQFPQRGGDGYLRFTGGGVLSLAEHPEVARIVAEQNRLANVYANADDEETRRKAFGSWHDLNIKLLAASGKALAEDEFASKHPYAKAFFDGFKEMFSKKTGTSSAETQKPLDAASMMPIPDGADSAERNRVNALRAAYGRASTEGERRSILDMYKRGPVEGSSQNGVERFDNEMYGTMKTAIDSASEDTKKVPDSILGGIKPTNYNDETQNKKIRDDLEQLLSANGVDSNILESTSSATTNKYYLPLDQKGKNLDALNTAKMKTLLGAFLGGAIRVDAVPATAGKQPRVCIEVTKPIEDILSKGTVPVENLLQSDAGKKIMKGRLPCVFGEDTDGNVFGFDLSKSTDPHVLISGGTNSGKSVLLDSLMTAWTLGKSKSEIAPCIVDPYGNFGTQWKDANNLLLPPVTNVEDVPKFVDALSKLADSQKQKIVDAGFDKISDYNDHMKSTGGKTLPYIPVVIDEADTLFGNLDKNTMEQLEQISKKARKAGIHLIIAGQRPDANSWPSGLKSQLGTRIALKANSATDSRITLGREGAEALAGYGDALVSDKSGGSLKRMKTGYISADDRRKIVEATSNGLN